MGSGLIFAILVVGWLAFLISWLVQRRDTVAETGEITDRFSESMTIIRRSADPFRDEQDPDLEVSTPLTRSAALYEIRQSNVLAARRRRNVVLTLLVATAAAVGLVVAQPLPVAVPWWVPVVPGALLVAFLAVARFSVAGLHRVLDARIERVHRGWEDETISFEVPAELRQAEHSIELSGPITANGSLWDPIPVTAPTYVSKPMVPRTVRTIDLAMPGPAASPVPVTAEAPDTEVAPEPTLSVEQDRPRAVGE